MLYRRMRISICLMQLVVATVLLIISSSVSMSHAIRRVLTQLHPRKSLKEVSVDSALPIQQGK